MVNIQGWFPAVVTLSMTDTNTACRGIPTQEVGSGYLATGLILGIACCATDRAVRDFFSGLAQEAAGPSAIAAASRRSFPIQGRTMLPRRPVIEPDARNGVPAPVLSVADQSTPEIVGAERQRGPVLVENSRRGAPPSISPAKCKPYLVNAGNHGWFSESNRGST